MPIPTSHQLTVPEFVQKWKDSDLKESAGSQTHFNDLCEMLGVPNPTQHDLVGNTYTFQKYVTQVGGDKGFADVWFRGHFGWEYKGKHKDLNEAYQQLYQYREDLENPPLLVVCDFENFEVHTQWTNEKKQTYKFNLDDILQNESTPDCVLPPLEVLRALWEDPGKLRPGRASEAVTEEAAKNFASLADSLRSRGFDPQKSAHFLMRLLFCMFAEGIGLLPDKLFSRLLSNTKGDPKNFSRKLQPLFSAMSQQDSIFGIYDIDWFNGGLFGDDEVLPLMTADLQTLSQAATLSWANVEPAVFGTLFERSLDPDKRSQLGAHYTSREDILRIVEPVLMAPLRSRWEEVRTDAQKDLAKLSTLHGSAYAKQRNAIRQKLLSFAEEISTTEVLDPACGSGNFLYVCLRLLLDLELEIELFAIENHIPGRLSHQVAPEQLYGLEVNTYAQELASVVVWIGYLQWLYEHNVPTPSRPILRPLDNIHRSDAILTYKTDGSPAEPQWPSADVIIGNPPFLGDKKMRRQLGDKYVDDLRKVYEGRIPGGSDIVCYWFEKAREMLEEGAVDRRLTRHAGNSRRKKSNSH